MNPFTTPRRGRPQGARRGDLRNWVTGQGQFTLGELARGMGWPLSLADSALRRACAAGELRAAGTVRQPHAKRPLTVYEPVRAGAPTEPQGGALLALAMRGWGR